MVRTLRSSGSQVVVLGPLPQQPGDVPDCLSARLEDATQWPGTESDVYDVGGLDREHSAVEAAGGHYVDVRPWLCAKSRCAVIVLATAFTAWLSPAVGAELDYALAHPAADSMSPTRSFG